MALRHEAAKKVIITVLKIVNNTNINGIYYSINSENNFVKVLKTCKTTLKNFLQF